MSLQNLLPEEERYDFGKYEDIRQMEDMLNYGEEEPYEYRGRKWQYRTRPQAPFPVKTPTRPQTAAPVARPSHSQVAQNQVLQTEERIGSWSFRWEVLGINAANQPFLPIPIGGGDVFDEQHDYLASAQLLSAITGKNITSAGKGNSAGVPYRVYSSLSLVESYLYNIDDPYYGLLLTLLRSRIAILPRMRVQVTDTAFVPYLQALRLYFIEVNPFRRFDSNAMAISQKFSAQQYQSGIIEFDFDAPLVLKPNKALVLDIGINSLGAINSGNQTAIFNIHFEGVRVINPLGL